MYAITTVLLATYAAAAQQKAITTGLRVHDGVDDKTSKYPYVVALKGAYPAINKICTGSLIKDTWVLSAAHCLIPAIKYIQYGNMSIPLSQTKSKSFVLMMIRHPRYLEFYKHDTYIHNDVGLIMVERISGMSKFAHISAVDYRTLLGHPVEYTGFGMTYFPKRNTKNKIQEFLLDIFRPLQIGEGVVTSCEDIPRKDLICVRAKCSHSTQMVLQGDSGGPLMLDNKIVGVTFAVGIEMFIQAFTPISPHLSWIHTVVTSEHHSRILTNAAEAARLARTTHKS